jgi:hypothetical protein
MSRKSIKPTQKPKSTRAIKKVESPPISMTPLTSLNISRNTIEFQPPRKSELEKLLDEIDEREMNRTPLQREVYEKMFLGTGFKTEGDLQVAKGILRGLKKTKN